MKALIQAAQLMREEMHTFSFFSLLTSEEKAGHSHIDEMPTGGVKIGTPERNKTLLEIGLHKEVLKAKEKQMYMFGLQSAF